MNLQSHTASQSQHHSGVAVGPQPGLWEQASLFAGAAEPQPAPGGQRQEQSGDQHLRAARRLSREIRGQRASRRARMATGLAICGHLLALLDAGTDSAPVQGALHKV
ncbi:MAG: hypothetical protein AB8B93_01410 [Pseudomonadales bacterium]